MFYDIFENTILNYENIIRNRNNSDYTINNDSMSKLNKVMGLLREFSNGYDGVVIKPVNLEPRRKSVNIEMYANGLYLDKGVICYLSDAMKLCDTVDIEALLDGRICVSMVIANVFIKKE